LSRLLLVRHGQTEFHKASRFCGRTDAALNDKGIRQAASLRDRLASEKLNAAYSSTLSRARTTAEVIASRHGLKVTACPELCEIDFGLIEGLTFDEISQQYPELAGSLNGLGTPLRFPSGESLDELEKRVQAFLKLLKKHKPEETILIVAHSGPLQFIVCHLLGIGPEHWRQMKIEQASLSMIDTYPQWAMLTLLNDVSHLKS
jgi:alpha-ribazole phosphatase